MKWGNVVVTEKGKTEAGLTLLTAELKLDDKDYKKTKKLHWITNDPNTVFEFTMVELDHLITKDKIEEEDDISTIVNRNSYIPYSAYGEGNMRSLK